MGGKVIICTEVYATKIWMTTLRKISFYENGCGALGVEGRERVVDYWILHTGHLYSVHSDFYYFPPFFVYSTAI